MRYTGVIVSANILSLKRRHIHSGDSSHNAHALRDAFLSILTFDTLRIRIYNNNVTDKKRRAECPFRSSTQKVTSTYQ